MPHDRSHLVDPDSPLPSQGASADRRRLAAVAAGGFLGTLARYEVDQAWTDRPAHFPLATFAINLSGALAIGVLLVVIGERLARPNPYLRPFLATGILGGWTTMSTLAVDTSTLARHGHPEVAIAYVGTTLAASLLAAALGAFIARNWHLGRTPP